MFRKKSLKVKLSLILIGIVLLISVSSVLLSNIFLKRFYLAKKNQTLISTFEKIDDMYAAELQGKTTESGESSSTDESLENYAIPDSGISDELYLQLDKLSQTRNLSVIIYRDMSSPIFDYMLKSNKKLLLYSSLGMNQNSKVESSNITAIISMRTSPVMQPRLRRIAMRLRKSMSSVWVHRISILPVHLRMEIIF